MTPRRIIRYFDKSVWNGPKTMEELRAQTLKMAAPKGDSTRPKTVYDRDQIFAMFAAGHTVKEIATKTGASVALISRIRSGKR